MSQLRVTSPALSTASTATSQLSSAETSMSSRDKKLSGFNYAELFQDIDWNEVNLIKLESDWRSELEQIERENVKALMDSTSKAQVVLPAAFKAIEEISKLSTIYEEYSDDLKTTGMEIQQIESLNRGLETQTANQQLLLDELQRIINVVALPDGVLDVLQKLPLDAPNSIAKIERAARELYSLLTVKFEGGIQDIKAVSDRLKYYNEQHSVFAKRLVQFISGKLAEITNKTSQSTQSNVVLPRYEDIFSFLSAYRPLILLCKSQSPREHYEICAAFQNSFGALVTRDLGKFFECLKASHLLKRPVTEPPSIFPNPALKATATFNSLATVGRTYTASTKNFTAMELMKPEDLPFLGANEFIYADQAMEFIILTIAMNIELNRRMVARLMFGCESLEASTTDLKINRKIQAIIAGVYASLGEKLPSFISQCIKLDESCSLDMLAVLDVRLSEIPEELAIFAKILEAVQQNLQSHVEFFLESQIEAIKATRYSAKKRSGVFSYVETFPRFIGRIEEILKACGVSSNVASSRSLINSYFEKIGLCIFDSFDVLNSEIEEGDEKGHINASVMTIENSHYLYKELTDLKLPRLDPIVRTSRTFYERSLVNYASLSIYRVLGRYAEYFEGLSNLLKTTAPQEVAFSSTYSKASVKKMLHSISLKDMKKAIDLLHQRVLKHLADQPKMIKIVWKAVQDDFMARQKEIVDGISKIFPGATDVSAPYSLSNLNDYFLDISKN